MNRWCNYRFVQKGDVHNLTALQKQYDNFVAELSKESMDANQPDSKGRLPLVEAVKTKDVRFVDALIQFGALATSKDPATGASPVQLAFQSSQKEVWKMFTSYMV